MRQQMHTPKQHSIYHHQGSPSHPSLNPLTLVHQQTPLYSKPPYSLTRVKIPPPLHSNICLKLSSPTFTEARSNQTGIWKWMNGLICVQEHPPFWDLKHYPCADCNSTHAIDPISRIAHCSTLATTLNIITNCYPPTISSAIKNWQKSATQLETRLFARFLIPTSLKGVLYNHSTDPPALLRPFYIKARKAIPQLLDFLHNNPPNYSATPNLVNTYYKTTAPTTTQPQLPTITPCSALTLTQLKFTPKRTKKPPDKTKPWSSPKHKPPPQ